MILSCFSLSQNFKKLFNISNTINTNKKTKSLSTTTTIIKINDNNNNSTNKYLHLMEHELTCIHGIRVISIVLIVLCHTLEWNNINMYSKSTFKFYSRHYVFMNLFRIKLSPS